jgi:hypothetical protein
MFEFEALESKKSGVYFLVNEHFFDESNEEIGHSRQTLNK